MWSDMDIYFLRNRYPEYGIFDFCISFQVAFKWTEWAHLRIGPSLSFNVLTIRTSCVCVCVSCSPHTIPRAHSWMHMEWRSVQQQQQLLWKKGYLVKRQLSTTRNKFANNKYNYHSHVSITCRQTIYTHFFFLSSLFSPCFIFQLNECTRRCLERIYNSQPLYARTDEVVKWNVICE